MAHWALHLLSRTGTPLFGKAVCGCLLVVVWVGALMDASSSEWSQGPLLPLPRAGYAAGVIENRYVLAGGTFWNGSNKTWSSRVDILDTGSNTWSEGASMPEPRGDAASAVVGDALYVFGGGDHGSVRSDVRMFRRGKWTGLTNAGMPEPRLFATAVTVADCVYVLGGLSRVGDYQSASNSIWKWESRRAGAKWEKLPAWPGPGLISSAIAAHDGAIYLFGGAEASGRDIKNNNSVFRFDCHSQRWSRLPDLPIATRCWWSVPVGKTALLIGGYTNRFQADVFEYNFDNYSLHRSKRLPQPVCDAKFFRIGQLLVGAGGEIGDRTRGSFTFEYKLRPDAVGPGK